VSIKYALGRAAAIAAAATGLAALGLTGMASASTGQTTAPAVIAWPVCTIQSYDGHYLSAIGGGGRTTDVIETNRTVLQEWEKFTLVPVATQGRTGWYAIQTFDGHYLTAVNSGGIGSAFDALHSNATQIQAWEEFYFNCG
jgi:hypothetical protein